MRVVLACVVVAACGTDEPTAMLCSESLDHAGNDPSWIDIVDTVEQARAEHQVVLFHGHAPGEIEKVSTIERVLDLAAYEHVPVLRYDEIATATDGGIALAIDDNAIVDWYALRPVFQHYGAHITFFVSRWDQQPPAAIDQLLQLAADGHELEPHTVNHLHALPYVEQHGLDAWLADEVDPSIAIMRQNGFEPQFFAYPFGERSMETDRAVLSRVAAVRATGHYCR